MSLELPEFILNFALHTTIKGQALIYFILESMRFTTQEMTPEEVQ